MHKYYSKNSLVPPDEAEKNPNATHCQAYLCGLTLSEYNSMKMES